MTCINWSLNLHPLDLLLYLILLPVVAQLLHALCRTVWTRLELRDHFLDLLQGWINGR